MHSLAVQTAAPLVPRKRRVVIQKPLPEGETIRLLATLGGRIALARHRRSMTQHDLAREIKRSQPLISLWERGHKEPGAEEIKALAKALRCTQSYLVNTPNRVA